MQPDLFKLLRVLVDEESNSKQFLILGSASRDLINQSSETLAGRIGYIEVKPFDLREFPNFDQLWLRGGFPRRVLAATDPASFIWRKEYIKSFFERDIPYAKKYIDILEGTFVIRQLRPWQSNQAKFLIKIFLHTRILTLSHPKFCGKALGANRKGYWQVLPHLFLKVEKCECAKGSA